MSRSGVEGEKNVLISHVLLTIITMKSRKTVKVRASRNKKNIKYKFTDTSQEG